MVSDASCSVDDQKLTRAAVVGGELLGGRFIRTGTEKFVETAARIRAFRYNRRTLGYPRNV
jgi:hypothetical protein